MPEMYITDYIMTFFTGVLNFEQVSRIFDIYIFEGDKIIYRAALAIQKINEKELLREPDMSNLS